MELHGRRVIYTDVDEINDSNVLEVLNLALQTHQMNAVEEQYLYDMYRGKQDISYKVKTTRPDINHIICENRAHQIVDFKTGYICGDPIVYTSVNATDESTSVISRLNDHMRLQSKPASDKDLFDWMHITGHGYRMVLPGEPFELIVPEPMNTFVIYSSRVGHKPVACVYFVKDSKNTLKYTLYTDKYCYRTENQQNFTREPYTLGHLPIVEYPLNQARLGTYEVVVDLLNAINYLDSDRLDAVTQFVNSLIVIYNARLPEGEDGNSIREQGLIELPSAGEYKADIKILSEQLDQTNNQTLKDDYYNAVLQIVGMPNQSDGSTSDSSNNGAMFLKQGYQLAEARAKDEEVIFKRSEREMLKLIARICNDIEDLSIDLADIDITFTRQAYQDLSTKATVLTTLLNNPNVARIDAWTLSGITPDPEECCRRGAEYYESLKNEESNTEISSEV